MSDPPRLRLALCASPGDPRRSPSCAAPERDRRGRAPDAAKPGARRREDRDKDKDKDKDEEKPAKEEKPSVTHHEIRSDGKPVPLHGDRRATCR